MLFSVWTCPERPDFAPVTGFLRSHDTEPNHAQKANTGQFYKAFYKTFGLRCMPANTRYRPLCPLDMSRHSPHCLAHYRAIVGTPAWCCRLITFSPCMGRYGVLCSGSIVPAGQLINATPRAANLYARPCLPRLSPPPVMRSMPADLRALFGAGIGQKSGVFNFYLRVRGRYLQAIRVQQTA